MRHWYHEVSEDWLLARKLTLTATDVSNLMPEYKRYLKQGSPDVPMPGFSALWWAKHTQGIVDTSSTDAAARGHVMEPYAVDAWNKQCGPMFCHWDDCIVIDHTGLLGFSPDAMTVAQETDEESVRVSPDGYYLEDSRIVFDAPKEIMEIKCYSPEQHLKSYLEKKMDHKELMQLAMAFCVMPKLERARLVWYCPGAPVPMFAEEYTADDLHDQIRWIMEIADVYLKTARYWVKELDGKRKLSACWTEDQIYNEHMQERSNGMFSLK